MQILLAVVLLLGIVAGIISFKRTHWSQVVLVLLITLTAVGYLFLASETTRVHRDLRSNLARLESQLANVERQNHDLLNGAGDEAGILQLQHKLEMLTRGRGRAWRQVAPAGPLDPQGRIEVGIPNPTPHGLAADSVVYVFEMGDANPADPKAGRQYLGEFVVVEAREKSVVLESTHLLDQRTGERLARSQGPWSLYESMPVDRYDTFAGMSEEELKKRLPPADAAEYLRSGQPATADDDPANVIGFDENDQRVPPNKMDTAVKKVYQRPLRDFAFLFAELDRQKAVLLSDRDALVEDNAKWEATLASAEKLGKFREDEIDLLESDLAGMKQDRVAIESHLTIVKGQIEEALRRIEDLLARNSSLAQQLADREAALRQMINATAPAPTVSMP